MTPATKLEQAKAAAIYSHTRAREKREASEVVKSSMAVLGGGEQPG